MTVAAFIVAASIAMAANAASPFDGTYVGVSATLSGTTTGGRSNSCVQVTAPPPVTVANGHAEGKWGDQTLQGDVGGDGKLVMHGNLNGRFEGQIDASGALKGNYAGYCIYGLVWRRR
jgi:hypothetical protein